MSNNDLIKEGEERQYWLDKFEGKAKSGVYWRGYDLIEFIKRCEKQLGKVVAIKLDSSYNIEFIYELKEV